MYDTIIIGNNEGAMAAAVYLVKEKKKVLVVSSATQKAVGDDSEFFSVNKLQAAFEKLAKGEFLEVLSNQKIVALEKNVVSFSIETKFGATHYGKTVIQTVAGEDYDLITHKNIKGKIKVDSLMRTNIPGVFAAGEAIEFFSPDILVNAGQGARAALSALEVINK